MRIERHARLINAGAAILPAGVEPASMVPETIALSIKLRELFNNRDCKRKRENMQAEKNWKIPNFMF